MKQANKHLPGNFGGRLKRESLQNKAKYLSRQQEQPKTLQRRLAETAKTAYKTMGLQYMGFIVVLLIYALIGGLIFHLIEGPVEMRQKADLLQKMEEEAWNLTMKLQQTNNSLEMYQVIREYQRNSSLVPPEKDQETRNWDFAGSLFYAGTIFTTTGYGYYSPASKAGQIATMCYAVIGIPLVLATLADLGNSMRRRFKKLWTCLCAGCKGLDFHKKNTSKQHFSENVNEIATAEEFDLPIPMALLLLATWLLMCSSIFCIWETEWSYFTAFYFFFISSSTIGLGDVAPAHPKLLTVCFPLIITGLSMVSMVINLIQNKIEALKERTTEYFEELGWATESSSDEYEDEAQNVPKKVLAPEDGTENLQARTLGVIQTWQMRARRKRCGIQTEESHVRDLKQRFPYLSYLEIPDNAVSESRDDVNSLIEALDIC